MKLMFLAVVLAVLAGCATRQVRPSEAADAPTDQVMAFSSPVEGGGTLTIVRDAGGSPCFAGVFVNGTLAAKLNKSEKARLYLPAGRAVVGSHLVGKGLCGLEIDERGERATQVVIAPGDTQFFRIAFDGSGVVTVTPVAQ